MITDLLEVATKLGVDVLPCNTPAEFGDTAVLTKSDTRPEVRVHLDTEFYQAYRISDEHLKDEAPCYLLPSSHAMQRGLGRTIRGRVLNVVAPPTAFESQVGEIVGDYPVGHLQSVSIKTVGFWDFIDSVIEIDSVRYTVIEAVIIEGVFQVWLDRPATAPINAGLAVRGGLLCTAGVSISPGAVGLVSAPFAKQTQPGTREQVSKNGFHFETIRDRRDDGTTDVLHHFLMGVTVVDPTRCTLVEKPATPAGLYF